MTFCHLWKAARVLLVGSLLLKLMSTATVMIADFHYQRTKNVRATLSLPIAIIIINTYTGTLLGGGDDGTVVSAGIVCWHY